MESISCRLVKSQKALQLSLINTIMQIHNRRSFELRFKVAVLGDSGVGKTALMTRLTKNTFNAAAFFSTIGVDFGVWIIELMEYIDANDPQAINMTAEPTAKTLRAQVEIWDTAGGERFRAIVSNFYRGLHGVMLTYDTTNMESLDNAVNVWLPELRQRVDPLLPILLVGTKADLTESRRVSLEHAQKLAWDNNLLLPVETSSKESSNVELAFKILAHQILKEHHGSELHVRSKDQVSLAGLVNNDMIHNCSC